MKYLASGLAACVLAVSHASALTLSFSAGEFSSWTRTSVESSVVTGQSIQNVETGGNPGAFLEVTTQSGAFVDSFSFDPSFTYDPSAGEIIQVRSAIDAQIISAFGQGMAFQPLAVEQDGRVFTLPTALTGSAIPPTPWTGGILTFFVSAADLVATDSSGDNPDFSTNGGVLTFGLYTANSGGNGITIGYDNYFVQFDTVPEGEIPVPGALPIMLSGLGALALRRRRARRAA